MKLTPQPLQEELLAASKTGDVERVFDPLELLADDEASEHGHLEVVKSLLEAGAAVDQAGCYGITPLLMASENGHLEVVKALLDAGADVSRAGDSGATPLITATQNGHLDVLWALLDAGADDTARSDDGETAFLGPWQSGPWGVGGC